MQDALTALIAVLVVLQVKHFFCDYTLQTLYMLRNKGTYFHPGGIIHSGLHAIASIAAFLVVMPTALLGVGLVVGEFLVHYHIDWSKEQVIKRTGWTAMMPQYWWAFGADQLLHQLTYLVMALILVKQMIP